MTLYIYAEDKALRELLREHLNTKHRYTDSGFDIPMRPVSFYDEVPEDFPINNWPLSLGIQVAATSDDEKETRPCLLLPRSSIGSTPFRITNSIGLIDQGYRGEVKAKVDILYKPMGINKGDRLFQICRHNFLPWNSIVIVSHESELPGAVDNRGAGGFGSTGR